MKKNQLTFAFTIVDGGIVECFHVIVPCLTRHCSSYTQFEIERKLGLAVDIKSNNREGKQKAWVILDRGEEEYIGRQAMTKRTTLLFYTDMIVD